MQRFETINDNLSNIFGNETVLEILTEFEGVLDHLDMYAYENWDLGEIVDGPKLERYWVTITLMYPKNKMPNPDAAARLTQHGCKVFYTQDNYIKPKSIDSTEDLEQGKKPFTNNQPQRRPKLQKIPVWLVKIEMPRHFIDSQATEIVRINDQDIDVDAVIDAYDENLGSVEEQQDDNN